MDYFKNSDCDCPGCRAAPCDVGCPCDVVISQFGTAGYDSYLNVRSGAGDPLLRPATLSIDFDAFTVADRLQIIIASAVDTDVGLIYDSGCISGSVSTSVLLPAGVQRLEVIVIHDCEATGDFSSWQLDLSCSDA